MPAQVGSSEADAAGYSTEFKRSIAAANNWGSEKLACFFLRRIDDFRSFYFGSMPAALATLAQRVTSARR
jgi:hypothetical protein